VAAPLAINDAVLLALAALLASAAAAALAGGLKPAFAGCRPRASFYAGAMLVAVCLLRASWPYGLSAILWLFAVVWGADVDGLFRRPAHRRPQIMAARFAGQRPGPAFGSESCAGPAPDCCCTTRQFRLPLLFALGLATGAVAQGGDLFESFLKRSSASRIPAI